MRRGHFEALEPVCPVCRRDRRVESPLEIAPALREEGDSIVEGLLRCPATECLREYPIVDGVPLLIPGIRAYVSEQIMALASREDLSPEMESILGDCCGPGSFYDA